VQEPTAMQPTPAAKRPFLPAALGVLGGIVVLVAVSVHWGSVNASSSIGGGSITVKGGGLAIGLGIALVVLGALIAALQTRGGVLGVSIAELAVGAVTVAIGLYFTLSKDPFIRAAARTLADRSSRSTSFIDQRLHDLVDRGVVSVSRGLGTYLALIGGALGLIGGIMGLGASRKLAAPAPSAPGMPFAGSDQPTGGPLGAPPPPPGEPGPPPPEGGAGGGPVAPLPPETPPAPGEPGSTPGYER